MRSEIFAEVKEQLNIKDVAEYYGLSVNRGGFVNCPFHDDKNPSMKIYEEKHGGDGHFHCYGCGEHGDAVGLVSKLFNLVPVDALNKLASDFGISVDLNRKLPKPSITARIKRYNYDLQENRAYRLIADYCDFLAKCRRDYAPKTHNEEPNPLFKRSITDLDKFEYYKDIFITGSKDERAAFMRDFSELLNGIERGLNKGRTARQAEELA